MFWRMRVAESCRLLRVLVAGSVVLSLTLAKSAAEPFELASPDGLYTLTIIDKQLPHADPVVGNLTLVLSRGHQVLSKAPTTGYLIDAMWSSENRYVAVNNRRGNSGDYVWVFSLLDGKILKKPDDKSFSLPLDQITKICPQCNEGNFDRDLTIAKSWNSANELQIETRWRFYKTALVLRRAIYRISARRMSLVTAEIKRYPVDWQPPE